MSPALALRGITRDLRGRQVLDNLDLVINPGECLALVGLNGAGKTTALRIALGMLRPGSGSAEVLGHDARTSGGEPWGAVGHLLELPFSYPELTARQNILASVALHGHDPRHVADHITGLADLLGLGDWLDVPARRLSLGTRQKVGLVAAMAHRPRLLVLDEPTAGMDVTMRKEFWELMSAQASKGKTILFATHYLAEAQDYAERTIIVNAGEITADAPTEEIRRTHSTTRLAFSVPRARLAEVRASLAARAEELGTTWELSEIAEAKTRESATESSAGEGGDGEQWVRVEFRTTFSDEAARFVIGLENAREFEVVFSSLDVFSELTQ